MNSPRQSSLWLPVTLMVILALTRWPGLLPENFSAVYALAFCAGVYFVGGMAWWLPLGTLFLSNIALNMYYGAPVVNFYTVAPLLGFAMLIGLGRCFKPRSSFWKLLGGGLLGAILFYLVTNTISWIFEPTQPYPKTLAGWIQALTRGTAGYPETWTFFRNSLLSGGLFTAFFVGAMRLGEASEADEAAEEAPEGEEESDPEPEEGKPQESFGS